MRCQENGSTHEKKCPTLCPRKTWHDMTTRKVDMAGQLGGSTCDTKQSTSVKLRQIASNCHMLGTPTPESSRYLYSSPLLHFSILILIFGVSRSIWCNIVLGLTGGGSRTHAVSREYLAESGETPRNNAMYQDFGTVGTVRNPPCSNPKTKSQL